MNLVNYKVLDRLLGPTHGLSVFVNASCLEYHPYAVGSGKWPEVLCLLCAVPLDSVDCVLCLTKTPFPAPLLIPWA